MCNYWPPVAPFRLVSCSLDGRLASIVDSDLLKLRRDIAIRGVLLDHKTLFVLKYGRKTRFLLFPSKF